MNQHGLEIRFVFLRAFFFAKSDSCWLCRWVWNFAMKLVRVHNRGLLPAGLEKVPFTWLPAEHRPRTTTELNNHTQWCLCSRYHWRDRQISERCSTKRFQCKFGMKYISMIFIWIQMDIVQWYVTHIGWADKYRHLQTTSMLGSFSQPAADHELQAPQDAMV